MYLAALRWTLSTVNQSSGTSVGVGPTQLLHSGVHGSRHDRRNLKHGKDVHYVLLLYCIDYLFFIRRCRMTG